MSQALVKKQQMEIFSIFILMISCIVFRIQVGDVGIGYMVTAVSLYETMWLIFGEHFSDIIGRIIRSKYSKGKIRQARLVWKYSILIQSVTGCIATVFFIIAGTIIMKNGFGFIHSYYLIWLLAPSFMVRMISESYCGFLVGRNYDQVTGFAYVIRNAIIMVMGVILSMAVKEYGIKVAALLKQEDFASVYGNFGILISVFVSEIVVLVFLMIFRLSVNKRFYEYEDDYFQRQENTGNILQIVWKRRFGENLNLLLLLVPFFILMIFLNKQYDSELLFSQNLGFIINSVAAPCGLFSLIAYISVLPATAKVFLSIKKHEMRYARIAYQSGLHFSLIISFLGASYLIVFGNCIAGIFYPDRAAELSLMLVFGAVCLILFSVYLYLLKILRLEGFGFYVALMQIVLSVAYGFILNGLLNSDILISNAVLISLIIYFAINTLLMLGFSVIKLDMSIDPVSTVIFPLICAGLSGLLNFLISKLMTPHLGYIFTCVFCFIEMLFVYLILLLFFRNFKENELEYIPGSRFIVSLGQLLHIL